MVVDWPGSVGIGDTVGVSSCSTTSRHQGAREVPFGVSTTNGFEVVVCGGGLRGKLNRDETSVPADLIWAASGVIAVIGGVEVRGKMGMSRCSVPTGTRLSSKVLNTLTPSDLPADEFVDNGCVKGMMGISGRRFAVAGSIGEAFVVSAL